MYISACLEHHISCNATGIPHCADGSVQGARGWSGFCDSTILEAPRVFYCTANVVRDYYFRDGTLFDMRPLFCLSSSPLLLGLPVWYVLL